MKNIKNCIELKNSEMIRNFIIRKRKLIFSKRKLIFVRRK